jgi:hypothetical protein
MKRVMGEYIETFVVSVPKNVLPNMPELILSVFGE